MCPKKKVEVAHGHIKNTAYRIGRMAESGQIFGKPPFMTMIVAAKASGKSCLVRYLTYVYAKEFSYITCITPTALNGYYSQFLPEGHIHDTYSDELIQKVVDKQEGFKKAGKDVHMLLILDDILASPDVKFEQRKASILNKLFAANRHWNISLLICSQKLKGLPRLCRDNVDFTCIGRTMRSAWDDLYDEYGNTDKKAFFTFLEDGTQNYRFLLYQAQVEKASEHFKCFSVPASFQERKFRMLF